MAYSFNGSSQYLSSTTTPISGPPFTVSAWCYPTSTVNASVILAITNETTVARHNMAILAGGTITVSSSIPGTFGASTTTAQIATNSWSNTVGVWTSASSRQAWLNGVAATANTTSVSPTVARMQIGARLIPTAELYFPGQIAEVGIWSAALQSAEILALYRGISPKLIRPQSLVFYAPLIRDLIDIRQGRAITNNDSASVIIHPRIYV